MPPRRDRIRLPVAACALLLSVTARTAAGVTLGPARGRPNLVSSAPTTSRRTSRGTCRTCSRWKLGGELTTVTACHGQTACWTAAHLPR